MHSIDITSDSLKEQGYRLALEGVTMAFYCNGTCKRTGFDAVADWDGSWRKLEKKLQDDGFPQQVISEVDSCMAKNYEVLVMAANKNKNNNNATIDGDDSAAAASSSTANTTTTAEEKIIELTEDLKKEIT